MIKDKPIEAAQKFINKYFPNSNQTIPKELTS